MSHKIPETIPNFCGECNYFKRTGKIDRYRGYCNFYEEKVYSSNKCLALNLLTDEEKIERGIIQPKQEEKPSENSLNREKKEDTDIGVQQSYQFKTLLSYGKFISGFGWFIGILGAIAIIGGLMSGEEAGFGIALGALLLVVIGIMMVVSGQLISCFVSIEKNTRTTYELLQREK